MTPKDKSRRRRVGPQDLGYLMLLAGIGICIWGYGDLHGVTGRFLVQDFYANLGTTFLGSGFVIVTVDRLSARRDEESRRASLAREMGSSEHPVACRAARELRTLHCLVDGYLDGADLSLANLANERLSSMRAQGARFVGANLRATQLDRSDLREALLNSADLSGANLEHADLRRAELAGTALCRADARAVNLSMADLTGAKISGADFRDADFSGANLSDVDLRDAKLARCKLGGATAPRTEFIPDHFPAPIHVNGQARVWPNDAFAPDEMHET